MGWRGAVRSMNASLRAAERDAQRRRKHADRMQMVSDAGDAVAEWQEAIHDLTSIHTDPADDIDWRQIAERAAPGEPQQKSDHQDAAQKAFDDFRPKFLDFLFGGSEQRRQRLGDAIPLAVVRDQSDYRDAIAQYHSDLAEWRADADLARRLLAGDVAARRDVVAEMQSLTSEGLIGTDITFRFTEDTIHAIARVHADEIVPNFRRKQLQSGRLSESKMPAGDFNELYQDYVCSAALRIAGDLFGLLPVEEVYVTCTPQMLNTSTGYHEATPILSVRFVRETFRRLRLANLDPSDALSNFVHAMDFKRAKGFSRIVPLKPLD